MNPYKILFAKRAERNIAKPIPWTLVESIRMNFLKQNFSVSSKVNYELSIGVSIMKLLISFFVVFLALPVAFACLEKPKYLTISEATFDSSVSVSVGMNCYPSVSIKNGDARYSFSFSTTENKLCLKTYNPYQENCSGPTVIPLKNAQGVDVGFISLRNGVAEILSADSGPTRNKPFLKIEAVEAKRWLIHAMQTATSEVGVAELKSSKCTRGLSFGSAEEGSVDLRGKDLAPGGVGCTSALVDRVKTAPQKLRRASDAPTASDAK